MLAYRRIQTSRFSVWRNVHYSFSYMSLLAKKNDICILCEIGIYSHALFIWKHPHAT